KSLIARSEAPACTSNWLKTSAITAYLLMNPVVQSATHPFRERFATSSRTLCTQRAASELAPFCWLRPSGCLRTSPAEFRESACLHISSGLHYEAPGSRCRLLSSQPRIPRPEAAGTALPASLFRRDTPSTL